MTVRGVILDIDGTLVDSNDAHAHAWVEALAAQGHDVSFPEVRRLIGMGGDNLLAHTVGLEKDSPQGKQASERYREIFKTRYLPHLEAFPGARKLLERMRQEGLKLVVGSSAKEEELNTLVEIAGASDLMEAKTSSSDVEKSKPEPDIVQAALGRLGVPADAAVMLGDTPYDIEAAGKAGVAVIALRCGGWDDRDLADAVALYDDPADLLRHYDDSLLAAAAPLQTAG